MYKNHRLSQGPCPISSRQREVCSAEVCRTTAAGGMAKTALLRTQGTISMTFQLPSGGNFTSYQLARLSSYHRVDPDGLRHSATLTLPPRGSLREGPRQKEAPVRTRTAGRSWDDSSFRRDGWRRRGRYDAHSPVWRVLILANARISSAPEEQRFTCLQALGTSAWGGKSTGGAPSPTHSPQPSQTVPRSWPAGELVSKLGQPLC